MHPVENIMRTTMEQLKEMVDVNTVIGKTDTYCWRDDDITRIQAVHGLYIRRRGIRSKD